MTLFVVMSARLKSRSLRGFVPIYLVSPQLLVTSEHIMSDKFSTSSFLSLSLSDAGVVMEFCGLENVSR